MLRSDLSRAIDPTVLAADVGLENLDDWQVDLLLSTHKRIVLNVTRQGGKSSISALLALHTLLYQAPALVLLVSPSMRQSGELFRTLMGFFHALGPDGTPDIKLESALRLELENGSRAIALPGSQHTVRGYANTALAIIDEAARVDDELISAVTPTMATRSDARLILLSTPHGQRGHFWRVWETGGPDWLKIEVPASKCPRISSEFLEAERREIGDFAFKQEYECQFTASEEMIFNRELIDAAMSEDVLPLWP